MTYQGRTFHPGQGNNSYIFPGVGLAAICVGLRTIGEDVFLMAAEVSFANFMIKVKVLPNAIKFEIGIYF